MDAQASAALPKVRRRCCLWPRRRRRRRRVFPLREFAPRGQNGSCIRGKRQEKLKDANFPQELLIDRHIFVTLYRYTKWALDVCLKKLLHAIIPPNLGVGYTYCFDFLFITMGGWTCGSYFVPVRLFRYVFTFVISSFFFPQPILPANRGRRDFIILSETKPSAHLWWGYITITHCKGNGEIPYTVQYNVTHQNRTAHAWGLFFTTHLLMKS